MTVLLRSLALKRSREIGYWLEMVKGLREISEHVSGIGPGGDRH